MMYRLGLFLAAASVCGASAVEMITRAPAFHADRPWGAVGRAAVQWGEDAKEGACLAMKFGGEGDQRPFAIVQGPNELLFEAWAATNDRDSNALVFRAKSERPVQVSLVLRVRRRDQSGPKGVIGHARASVAVAGPNWAWYAVRLADFRCDPAVGTVDARLFDTTWPQPQFHVVPAKEAVRVWVSALGLGRADESSSANLPFVFPGRDRHAELNGFWGRTEEAVLENTGEPRERWEISKGWLGVPWRESGTWGEARTIDIPAGFPGRRDYHAAWHLTTINVTRRPGTVYRLAFERVDHYCAAWVNGRPVGEHGGGAVPFAFAVTEALLDGENRIACYVMDSTWAIRGNRALGPVGVCKPTSRARGGILGRVYVEAVPVVHVADTTVLTSVREKTLTVTCTVRNASKNPVATRAAFRVRDWRTGEEANVVLPPVPVQVGAGESVSVVSKVQWPLPRLWSPEHPDLYTVTVSLGTGDRRETRFGFREFRIENGRFLLNEIPIRLRGESNLRGHHQPPCSLNRRWLRTLFRAYRDTFGANAFRVHAHISCEPVLEVADEEGFLLIDQSSVWSAMGGHYLRGGREFLVNAEGQFGEWVRRDRNHPSVVIWDSENEMIRGGGRSANMPWVQELDRFIRAWDTSRPISHSGAGWFAEDQELYHIHMEEHYTNLFDLWDKTRDKPLINGEYWVGGRGELRLPTSREVAGRDEFWQEEARCYHEAIIEQRARGVDGIMPFTIQRTAFMPLFEGSPPAVSSDPSDPDPRPKQAHPLLNPGWIDGVPPYRVRPGVKRLLHNGLAPATAFFWPRVEAGEAGKRVGRTLVVCNDHEGERAFTVRWSLDGQALGEKTLRLGPAAIQHLPIEVPVPPGPGVSTLRVALFEGKKPVTDDTLTLRRVSPRQSVAGERTVWVTEKGSDVLDALADLGVQASRTAEVPTDAASVWILGPGAVDVGMAGDRSAVRQYVERGGRIFCLSQTSVPAWVPTGLNTWSAARKTPVAFAGFGWEDGAKDVYYSRHAPIYAPEHPLFDGLPFPDMRWWDAHDGRVSDDSLARACATGASARGNWRALLGGTRRENIGLAEVFLGEGVMFLAPMHMFRQRANPEARRLLLNALAYLRSTRPVWSERAVAWLGSAEIADRVAAIVGMHPNLAGGAPDGDARVLIACPGSEPEQVRAWVRATGDTALVLSAEVSSALTGVSLVHENRMLYAACRGKAHPLFQGVCSASFEDLAHPSVRGVFRDLPEGSTVLLRGRQGPKSLAKPHRGSIGFHGAVALDDACGAAAFSVPEGNGMIVATTVEPFDPDSAHAADILTTLLTNAGLRLPTPGSVQPRFRVLQTVPLRLDGDLSEWTSDIEDANVSRYRHADPIVLGQESVVSGPQMPDQTCSAILYVLWDRDQLYVAGVLIGRRAESRLRVRIGKSELVISPSGDEVMVEEGQSGRVRSGGQRLGDVRGLADTRFLTFAEIDRRIGDVRPVSGAVPGMTFECAVPLGDAEPTGDALPLTVVLTGPDGHQRALGNGEAQATLILVPGAK